MKKIIFAIAIAFMLTSCGPTAFKMEEERLQDSIQSSKSSTTSQSDIVTNFKVEYYQDLTTGITFAVMQCCGELKMEIVPQDQLNGIKITKKFRSN